MNFYYPTTGFLNHNYKTRITEAADSKLNCAHFQQQGIFRR